MKKCVIYARVSSREQKENGYSTEAQIALLKEYAKRNNFEIAEVFEDVETAKVSGRTKFNAMLKYLRQHKSVNIILVEKTDRLYRNFKDYVTIDEIKGLQIHLVKESEILGENSSSHCKFIHGIKVLMAKNYADNLSEEVKKGNLQKALKGECPSPPPIGYYRASRKEIKIDRQKAPLVIRAYNIYSEGNLSLKGVCEQLYDEGFVYGENRPKIYPSALEKVLKNQFYLGNFKYRNVLYQGNHEPLVDVELFEKVQKAFKKDNKPNSVRHHNFMFSGMFTCAHCGSAITGELKKGKYIYYSCGNKIKTCPHKSVYVREEEIKEQVNEVIKNIEITTAHKQAIVEALKESHIQRENTILKRLKSSTHSLRS